jgi:hydroxylamine reductase (hybrid-cluster protein)
MKLIHLYRKHFFSTLTNVNFDSDRIEKYAVEAIRIREKLIKEYLTEQEKRAGYFLACRSYLMSNSVIKVG